MSTTQTPEGGGGTPSVSGHPGRPRGVPQSRLGVFQVLYELAVAMTADHTLGECLKLVVDRARELLSTDTAYIALRDEARGEVVMHALAGIRTQAFREMRVPLGSGLGGLVARTRRGYVVDDYFAEKKIKRVVDEIVAAEGLISGMAAPIQMGHRNLGVLYVFNRERTSFSPDDLDLLFLIANLAAVEIFHKRVEEALTEAHEGMEERVVERTAELASSNALLSQEVAERARAEEALRTSEERFRILVEELPLGVSLVGRDGTYKYLNPAFTALFGYELADVPNGRRWLAAAFPDPDRRREARRAWRTDVQGAPGGVARRHTFAVHSRDGLEKVVQFHTVTLRTGDHLVIHDDITARTQLEAQLLHAQKMEAVGTLASGVAHDFNNLLQAISGYTSLLLDQGTSAAGSRDYLRRIEGAADRAADLVKRLLAFSRKEAPRLQAVDLNRQVAQSLRLLERTIPKMIEVRTDLSPLSPSISADPHQLDQIVINLVTNARDAMPSGGQILVETSTAELDEAHCLSQPEARPGAYVLLRVSDTGSGMEPATLRHIFEPFFTTKRVGEGTGLGLSTVYGIVKSHGGHLTCQSAAGSGTTFCAYFPALQATTAAEPVAADPAHASRGRGETILVVDDEAAIRDLSEEFLTAHGYRVMQARTGEEALACCRAEPEGIDLVLLDLGMPGIGGIRCLAQLLRERPQLKVVVASGYSAHGPVRDLRAAGAAGFLSKPYRKAELLDKVGEVLAR